MLPQCMLLRMNTLLQIVVKKNLPAFQDYQINEYRLYEFFMRYFEGSSRFATLTLKARTVFKNLCKNPTNFAVLVGCTTAN